ncbi:AraC family transcriptional regulator [Virgibacillus pantothenticus]|uniref:AraC family transcriptional regulator n=1 Tax=Virgibacillus pantothenticus TaxID=1473 RepID=UPI00098650E2|nr:AraC family transcriptional regulator [Virgibacillus pantothenticus]
MNYILFGNESIASFSDVIKAECHRHWMIQLFLSLDEEMTMEVDGQQISFRCIIINSNRTHKIDTAHIPHFTMLIDSTSAIGRQMRETYLQNNAYYVLNMLGVVESLNTAFKKVDTIQLPFYEIFVKQLLQAMSVDLSCSPNYDSRIQTILQAITTCREEQHSLQPLANLVGLSKSRLSHLFKAETDTPLKSFLLLHQLKKAYSYLLEHGDDITTSAMKAGFDSPSHFAATSKKMTGMTASDISKDSVFLKVSFP